MGAVGTGIVTDVTDCPEIQPGKGQVITATFRHPPSTDVLDVTFVDESTWEGRIRKEEGGTIAADSSFTLPPSSLGVTDNHTSDPVQ